MDLNESKKKVNLRPEYIMSGVWPQNVHICFEMFRVMHPNQSPLTSSLCVTQDFDNERLLGKVTLQEHDILWVSVVQVSCLVIGLQDV